MGRLVADAGNRGWDELTAEYGVQLMEGLTLLLGQSVCGATLGIVGMGRIGQAVAKRACGERRCRTVRILRCMAEAGKNADWADQGRLD